jgi:hypothetical protein
MIINAIVENKFDWIWFRYFLMMFQNLTVGGQIALFAGSQETNTHWFYERVLRYETLNSRFGYLVEKVISLKVATLT